jgi:hypothetical protein
MRLPDLLVAIYFPTVACMSVVEFGEYRDEVGKAPACYVFEKT